ncbi:hypothetical protein EOPP23_15595 [Endozoicomonas sp. OPT23]|uniref:hypothetical protein n=1 Tax=Endozoicomonas sp. OPT23 TaxID=2072845 RepID=UPI00129B4639|nr:hypothetical protein [Endozoicomonas sp. OPT23]MRI34413.1 hypothetical protein [Endozoicomonas sp. OPT23]
MDLLFYLAFIAAVAVLVGETLVLIKTDKYWPLSVDDYLVSAGLLIGAFTLGSALGAVILLVSWSFMAGNAYAMLFTRMDPKTGSRERLGLLVIMALTAVIGVFLTGNHLLDVVS